MGTSSRNGTARDTSSRNPNAVAVPMLPHNVSDYECLADDVVDEGITADLSNQLEILSDNSEPPMKTSRKKRAASSPLTRPLSGVNSVVAPPTFEQHVDFTEPTTRNFARTQKAHFRTRSSHQGNRDPSSTHHVRHSARFRRDQGPKEEDTGKSVWNGPPRHTRRRHPHSSIPRLVAR